MYFKLSVRSLRLLYSAGFSSVYFPIFYIFLCTLHRLSAVSKSYIFIITQKKYFFNTFFSFLHHFIFFNLFFQYIHASVILYLYFIKCFWEFVTLFSHIITFLPYFCFIQYSNLHIVKPCSQKSHKKAANHL